MIKNSSRIMVTLLVVVAAFLFLAVGFILNLWGRVAPLPKIPLVDPQFISTTPLRASYSDLVRSGADLSDFDCYTCHEKDKPPVLRFDNNHKLLIPKEHADIVMAHGANNRNEICTNCHDETNLLRFQTRDGRELTFAESTELCGSCHGPTYEDWVAGAHGRTSGYWNLNLGKATRLDCVSCHDPHAPLRLFHLKPAPGPHPLHPSDEPGVAVEGEH